MQITPLKWDDAALQIESLGELTVGSGGQSSFGMASFPVGIRQPAEGFVSHEQTEVSFILDGEFHIETPTGTTVVPPNSLVVIPAGEQHASVAVKHGRVVYFLIPAGKE